MKLLVIATFILNIIRQQENFMKKDWLFVTFCNKAKIKPKMSMTHMNPLSWGQLHSNTHGQNHFYSQGYQQYKKNSFNNHIIIFKIMKSIRTQSKELVKLSIIIKILLVQLNLRKHKRQWKMNGDHLFTN